MSGETEHILHIVEEAVRDDFRKPMRTAPMTPALAADMLQRIPAGGGLDPATVAAHLRTLPPDTREGVRLGKSANQTVLTVSVPGDRRVAFEWANELVERMSASGVKMNLGPAKTTDLKVFWGKPDVNTLIEIGYDD